MPAEPALALAAIKHLSDSWPTPLQTLTSELLGLGAINEGLKGELFARLMLTLARDYVAYSRRWKR